jgi:hypothetical protein
VIRGVFGWVQRGALVILTGVASIALFLSSFAVVKYTQTQSQRESDRVRSDVEGCERGNVLRGQIIELGQASEDLITGILDVLTGSNPNPTEAQQARVEAFRGALAPLFVKYESKLAQVTLTDCDARVPGAGG